MTILDPDTSPSISDGSTDPIDIARRPRHGFWTTLRSPVGIAATVTLLTLVFFAIFGPVLWGATAGQADLTKLSAKPSPEHLLGTDAGGRDVLARVLTATRLSLTSALMATAIAVSVGVLAGLLPIVAPRRIANAINGVIGVALAFPALLLAIVVSIMFGAGLVGVSMAIGLAIAPSYARLTQTLGASVAGRDFVAAARILGAGRTRILVRHILPNVRDPLIVNASIGAGTALVAATGLSFLGLGVQAPRYDWGRMLGESLNSIYVNPAASLGLCAAIVLAGVTFALTGEALARALGVHRPAGRGKRRPSSAGAEALAVAQPQLVVDDAVLSVRGLTVQAPQDEGWSTLVDGVSFDVGRGEIVGIVGESGSGKSLTCMAVARLLEQPLSVAASSIRFDGTELAGDRRSGAAPRGKEVAAQLGTRMALVFQDPSTSLNPSIHVGTQVAEIGELHGGLSRKEARRRAIDRLGSVRIPDPERRADQYPHEFSGGMRQRAMIAMGLMGEPALIIADEPTTALDVTVQREVLSLLHEVNQERGTAVMFVSHDIALVSSFCTRVLVMYRGSLVEDLTAADLASGRAQHPYTRALAASVPRMDSEPGSEFATIHEGSVFDDDPSQGAS